MKACSGNQAQITVESDCGIMEVSKETFGDGG